MIRGYKIRIYPTAEQERIIWMHIGACRFVWNHLLELQMRRRENNEKHLSKFEMMRYVTTLKHDGDHDWLNNISCGTLQRVCVSLADGYNLFFKKQCGFPKFKSRKRSKPSYPLKCAPFYFDGQYVRLPRLGRVRYKSDYKFPQGENGKYNNAHITFVNGKYMLSFGMECENQAHMLTDKSMGIDLGIKELAVVACGDERLIFHNINKSKKVRELKRKLKHTQRTISRKYEASKARTGKYEKTKNIEREEEKLRKIYARLTGIRQNHLHQTTHEFVSMLPKRVVMEGLNVSGMMKNKHLSKAIAEQCFYEFIRQMKYKCEWNGIEFVQVHRFYPSSKTCSCCGSIKRDLKLSDRTYVCPDCGFTIDRDFNAAINLMRYENLQTQVSA